MIATQSMTSPLGAAVTAMTNRLPPRGQKVELTCDCGCGELFLRRRSHLSLVGPNFVDRQHAGAYKTRAYLEDMCGPFHKLVTEYLDGFASNHYKNLSTIRSSVCPFVLYLTECGMSDVRSVTPKTITRFLSWAEEMEYLNARHDISVISTFLDWAIREGHRPSPNPVVPKFHASRRKHYLPRPYSGAEMEVIWEFARTRGSSRLRAALAIGEESGLRISEICRLRLQDVDLVGRRLFVRLPNKTDCERWAPFSDKTVTYIAEWLEERTATATSDALFHNRLGSPLLSSTLHNEFCRAFCRVFDGCTINEDGLEQWSTHRLRHTMASNLTAGGASIATVMMTGGWQSVSSMMTYAKNDPAIVRRGYDEAMSQIEANRNKTNQRRLISPHELLALLASQGVQP